MRRRSFIWLLLAFVIVFSSSWILDHLGHRSPDLNEVAENASKELIELQRELNDLLEVVSRDSTFLADPFSSHRGDELSSYQERGLYFFVYTDDSINYWSSNGVPMPSSFPFTSSPGGMHWVGNGWYVAQGKVAGNSVLLSLIQVSQEFPFQNEYLSNSFLASLGIPSHVTLSPEPGDFSISGLDGNHLFSLQSEGASSENLHGGLISFLVVLSYVLLLILLFRAHVRLNPFPRFPSLHLIAFTVDAFLIRLLINLLELPRYLYDAPLFQPFDFSAGFLLNSTGDLVLNIITFTGISLAVSKGSRHISPVGEHRFNKYLSPFSGTLLVFFSLLVSVVFSQSIFLHSSVVLNLGQLFSFNGLSFLFFLLIIVSYSSSLLLTGAILNRFIIPSFHRKHTWAGVLFALIVVVVFSRFSNTNVDLSLLLTVILIVLGVVSWRYTGKVVSLISVFLAVFAVSVASTYQHNHLNTEKEHQRRILLADALSQEQDPVSEYLFREALDKMKDDKNLVALLNADSLEEDVLSRYLLFEYFNKDPHWQQYTFQVTICFPNQDLIIESDISPDYVNVNCDTFFQGLIVDLGRMTMSKQLFSIDYGTGQDSYLGVLRFPRRSGADAQELSVYIEFISKDVRSDLGFPSLLTDKSSDVSPLGYSYAYYRGGKLLSSYGKFTYNIDLNNYGDSLKNLEFFQGSDFHHNYDHLYHRIDSSRILLLSRVKQSLLEQISPLSYFFLSFLLVQMFIMLLFVGRERLISSSPSFRSRLQVTFIGIIIISFVAIGLASISYIRNLNQKKNFDELAEKAHSVLIEVEHKLSGVQSLNPDITPYLTKILTKFSRVFFTDINLFDLNGQLLASSRPQIFDEQLISTQMHPVAFRSMYTDNKSLFIHRENIGGLGYLSAYVPFRNENDELVAYLNLPYFIKEQELNSEITAFMVAFINIYALLIAVSILLTLFFSNLITRPLIIIRDYLRTVRLDSTNARIDMVRSDEIGELVQEYNRMVDELGHSAELLAASERQSAWREMAKQVAHEIKNPLTPMKLSVQYLEKAWQEKDPDWENRLRRFTHTIIEQIESLSQIATEFSDFAKMPESRKEKVFLEHILTSSAEIFGDIDQVGLAFNYDPSSTYPVYADKKQLLRAFNNLINNARQAVQDMNNGRVEILLRTEGDEHIVEVSDNGPGIDPEKADKIFSPNFTTKSGGMGLGLAIVRNIVEESSGTVHFVPGPEAGVTFVIKLPHYKPGNMK